MTQTHYDVLGVAPDATPEQIRRAYHLQARRHHPDANPGAPTDERRRMVAVNAAWEVLGNPARRHAYDRDLGVGARSRPPTMETREGGAEADDDIDADVDADLDLDGPEPPPHPPRPADLLVVTPVVLLLLAIGTLAFGTMTESEGLRTIAILLVPVTIAGFVAAPLFVMLRARSRDR